MSKVPEKKLLEIAGVSEDKYYKALKYIQTKISIIYKRKPSEVNVGPYNTVILSLLKANMNIQFVTGIYAMLTYLTSYLCKPEHHMSELMKKATKEAYGKSVKDKMRDIGNIFITKREVSTHEAIKRVLSLPMRHSNVDVKYIATGLKKNRTRMLKPQSVLEKMHPDDTNVYALSILDKYENRPDSLEDLCLADFVSNYESKKVKDLTVESEDIESYTVPVSDFVHVPSNSNIVVLKNNLGEMRKRNRPCVIRFHKISKLKNPEEYYLRILQLYLPWRDENDLKHDDGTYATKYEEVESDILDNIKRHEPYLQIDYDDLYNHETLESENDDDDDDNNEFSMLNPNLLDYEDENLSGLVHVGSVAPATINDITLPNNMYYEICSQLNCEQRHLLNFILTYAIQCRFAENYNTVAPDPFYIFLSGGAGVGKSYLAKAIIECLVRILKYPGQNLDQPSILVTASTGKAATGINGITLHSAFHLPIKRPGRSFQYQKPRDEVLHLMRNKYKYLVVLLIDEISMVGDETFDHLDQALKYIKQNSLPFGGVSMLPTGDFFQLPPVGMKCTFMSPHKGCYKAFQGSLWRELFQLHELFQLVRQISDPVYASILSRIRDGTHTNEDLDKIMDLAHTDTTHWPDQFVKLYLTNYLAGRENDEAIAKLNSEIFTIQAKDLGKDLTTGTCDITIPDYFGLNKTGSLPAVLKLCVGARFMVTVNIDVSDRLINGSIGTVKLLHINPNYPLFGEIYVKFDDLKAGNSLKNNRLRGELKHCVPIRAIVQTFPFKKGNTSITVQRKQFPGILAHGITIHKSQGSTLEYMEVDLDRTTQNKRPSKSGHLYLTPIGPGQVYTALSRAQSRDQIRLSNFQPEHIKVNQLAVDEMLRMRNNSRFNWKHPLLKMSGCKMSLLNIRSWNVHIEHFLSDKVYTECCSVLCFTETNINTGLFSRIRNYDDKWNDIHKITDHGLAICYNINKIQFVKEFPTTVAIEIMAVLLQHENEHILVVLVYRPPGAIGAFVASLIAELRLLPTSYRTLIIGDFNLDQRLPGNEDTFKPLIEEFHLTQRSNFSTHIYGGNLDLVFDNDSSDKSVFWIPTPFSDHLILLISI